MTDETALDTIGNPLRCCDEHDTYEPDCATTERCPVCHGIAELTPSGFLTCREHGSAHYRVQS